MTVFSDPLEMTIRDPFHSEEEERFISLGRAETGRLIVVSYTERNDRVRLISARDANPKERRQYESANPS